MAAEAGVAARIMGKLSVSSADSYVDWYDVFGLTEEEVGALGRCAGGAEEEEEAGVSAFKRAFRKLAIQLHPDRCKEVDAGEAFAGVRKGYDFLVGGTRSGNAGNETGVRSASAEARANRRRFHVEWLTRKGLTDEEKTRNEKARDAVAPVVTAAYKRNDGRGRCDVCFGAVRSAGSRAADDKNGADGGLAFMMCSCPTPTPWTCGCGQRNSRTDEIRCSACSTVKGARWTGIADGTESVQLKTERKTTGSDSGAASRTDALLAPKKAGFKRPKRRRPPPT